MLVLVCSTAVPKDVTHQADSPVVPASSAFKKQDKPIGPQVVPFALLRVAATVRQCALAIATQAAVAAALVLPSMLMHPRLPSVPGSASLFTG